MFKFDAAAVKRELAPGGDRIRDWGLNTAIGDFCKNDQRMIRVGFLPLDNPPRAQREIEQG